MRATFLGMYGRNKKIRYKPEHPRSLCNRRFIEYYSEISPNISLLKWTPKGIGDYEPTVGV